MSFIISKRLEYYILNSKPKIHVVVRNIVCDVLQPITSVTQILFPTATKYNVFMVVNRELYINMSIHFSVLLNQVQLIPWSTLYLLPTAMSSATLLTVVGLSL